MNAFFRRGGVATPTTRELFDFVVDPLTGQGASLDAALGALMELAARLARSSFGRV